MSKFVVGLSGPAGAGKSTAAQYLVELGGHRVRFAGIIKSMIYAMGLNERQVDGDLKEVPCDLLCGKTPRWAMQSLGTEWGRNLIGPNIWINLWKNQVNSLPEDALVLVDDCRFPNEEVLIREMDGIIIRIVREVDMNTETFSHESEKHPIKADYTVINDGSIEQLQKRLYDIVFWRWEKI